MHKRGFTLIELAIVFVVIGLIIGGVLTAQSITTASKGQAILKDLQQLDITVKNFQTKYNALPGASKDFGGNGDDNITDQMNNPSSGVPFSAHWGGELGNFWMHLQAGGFTSKGITFTNVIPLSDPVTILGNLYWRLSAKAPLSNLNPVSGLGNNMGYNLSISCTASACASTYVYTYYLANVLIFDGSTNMFAGQALPSGYAQIIDSKLDDGVPTTGKITSTNLGGGCYTGGKYQSDYSFHNEVPQYGCYTTVPAWSQ